MPHGGENMRGTSCLPCKDGLDFQTTIFKVPIVMDWYSKGKEPVLKLGLQELKRKLITANHILHYHGVVDAYGHISVRHPDKPDVYIMCGYLAPACVTSSDDLIEYYVKDSSTVDLNAKKGYSERFIHGEIFKMYPQVNCVVHSHAEAVLPYVTSGVPLMPVFHMAGFLGQDVPVYDIEPLYAADERHDMLVKDPRMGSALASHFSKDPEFDKPALDYNVVLMRRHGYTTHGVDIETAVYRAIYTKINAGVQTNSMLLRQAFNATSSVKEKFDFDPLTPEQCEGCIIMNEGTQDKPWKLWVQEVEASNLYVNRG